MLLTEAKDSDIREMKERLSKKKQDRIALKEIDQVIEMVQRRPLPKAPENNIRYKDKCFIKGIGLLMLAFPGALAWNLTSKYIFIIYFFIVSFLSYKEIIKSFT